MKKAFFVLFVFLSGCCDIPDTVDVSAEVSLDDECLRCYPGCYDDRFDCHDLHGNPCEDCFVSCLGAVDLTCEDETPTCWNHLAGELVEMPVICESRE